MESFLFSISIGIATTLPGVFLFFIPAYFALKNMGVTQKDIGLVLAFSVVVAGAINGLGAPVDAEPRWVIAPSLASVALFSFIYAMGGERKPEKDSRNS